MFFIQNTVVFSIKNILLKKKKMGGTTICSATRAWGGPHRCRHAFSWSWCWLRRGPCVVVSPTRACSAMGRCPRRCRPDIEWDTAPPSVTCIARPISLDWAGLILSSRTQPCRAMSRVCQGKLVPPPPQICRAAATGHHPAGPVFARGATYWHPSPSPTSKFARTFAHSHFTARVHVGVGGVACCSCSSYAVFFFTVAPFCASWLPVLCSWIPPLFLPPSVHFFHPPPTRICVPGSPRSHRGTSPDGVVSRRHFASASALLLRCPAPALFEFACFGGRRRHCCTSPRLGEWCLDKLAARRRALCRSRCTGGCVLVYFLRPT